MSNGAPARQISADEVLVEVGEEHFVVAAACPHRKGRLAFALINQRTLRITCPLHHSTFDLRTGGQISGPTCSPLPTRGVDRQTPPEGDECPSAL